MIQVSIPRSEIMRLMKKYRRLGAVTRSVTKSEVKQTLEAMQQTARELAPRSPLQPPVKYPERRTTGRLKKQIKIKRHEDGLSGTLTSNRTARGGFDVARAQEFGARKMIARPFLGPSFQRHAGSKKFIRRLARRLRAAARRMGRA